MLVGADHLAHVDIDIDIDDTVKATYGYAKQGAGYGYSGVKGLNAAQRRPHPSSLQRSPAFHTSRTPSGYPPPSPTRLSSSADSSSL